MQTRQLGRTDLRITPVSFGAWAIGGWMWGGTDESESIDAIHASLDAGVNAIDTAAIYGMGYSEEIVAKALQGRDRGKIVIATKCGMRWDTDEGSDPWPHKDNDGRDIIIRKNAKPHSITYECEQSLRRLKTEVIDLYQLHWPDESTPIEDSIHALDLLRKAGKVRAIGVSNFNLDQLKLAAKTATIDSIQPRYNLVMRSIEPEILPFCRENKIGVLAYSPIERGLLSGKVGPERKFPEGDHRTTQKAFSTENRARVLEALEEIKPITDRHRATFAQIAIAWVFEESGITTALVGARNAQQARDNAHAMSIQLSEDERVQIRKVFDEPARLIAQ